MSERTPRSVADNFTTQRTAKNGKGVKFRVTVRAYADGVLWLKDELTQGSSPEPFTIEKATAAFAALCERALAEAKTETKEQENE